MNNFTPGNPFAMLCQADNLHKLRQKIVSREEYEHFKKEFVFEKLKGLTFGEAFCKKFGIIDNVLSTVKSESEADYIIRTLGYIK